MPLSFSAGFPEDPTKLDAGRWTADDVVWSLAATYNESGRQDGLSLAHATDDGWKIVARLPDRDQALAAQILDFEDSDPDGLAVDVVNRLLAESSAAPPGHVVVAATAVVTNWICHWRGQAATAAYEASA